MPQAVSSRGDVGLQIPSPEEQQETRSGSEAELVGNREEVDSRLVIDDESKTSASTM